MGRVRDIKYKIEKCNLFEYLMIQFLRQILLIMNGLWLMIPFFNIPIRRYFMENEMGTFDELFTTKYILKKCKGCNRIKYI